MRDTTRPVGTVIDRETSLLALLLTTFTGNAVRCFVQFSALIQHPHRGTEISP
jgi:hypothetical protein